MSAIICQYYGKMQHKLIRFSYMFVSIVKPLELSCLIALSWDFFDYIGIRETRRAICLNMNALRTFMKTKYKGIYCIDGLKLKM